MVRNLHSAQVDGKCWNLRGSRRLRSRETERSPFRHLSQATRMDKNMSNPILCLKRAELGGLNELAQGHKGTELGSDPGLWNFKAHALDPSMQIISSPLPLMQNPRH